MAHLFDEDGDGIVTHPLLVEEGVDMEGVRRSVVFKREFAESIVAGCGSGLRVAEFAFLRDARCKFRPVFFPVFAATH